MEKDGLEGFHAIIDGEHNFTAMCEWLKEARTKLPPSYGDILLYTTLTGLRAQEAIHSIELVKTDLDKYRKKDILEHCRYPDLFIRRTKKAYISIIDDSILEVARKSGSYSYTAIRMALDERGMTTQMKYCRKIFSTYLWMNGGV